MQFEYRWLGGGIALVYVIVLIHDGWQARKLRRIIDHERTVWPQRKSLARVELRKFLVVGLLPYPTNCVVRY